MFVQDKVFNMQDKTITCRDCGQPFTFNVSKQQLYAQRGYSDPTRCPFCQVVHQSAQGNGAGHDGHAERWSAPGTQSDRKLYAATCSSCGKRTQVPFEPRGDRPVYCSDCYQERSERSGGYNGGARGRDRERSSRSRR